MEPTEKLRIAREALSLDLKVDKHRRIYHMIKYIPASWYEFQRIKKYENDIRFLLNKAGFKNITEATNFVNNYKP